VAVTFHVGHAGNVVKVEDASGDFPNADVRGCVARALSTLLFPEPDRGSAQFTYPFKK
jgi:hypothetical protein